MRSSPASAPSRVILTLVSGRAEPDATAAPLRSKSTAAILSPAGRGPRGSTAVPGCSVAAAGPGWGTRAT